MQTNRFAKEQINRVVGIDRNPRLIAFATKHAHSNEFYLCASAEKIPFPTDSFDYVIAITSLCTQAHLTIHSISTGIAIPTGCYGADTPPLICLGRLSVGHHRQKPKKMGLLYGDPPLYS
ncbi:MAG: class I SAM-dependent methyltransferase [Sphaerochaetaceae bacterium]